MGRRSLLDMQIFWSFDFCEVYKLVFIDYLQDVASDIIINVITYICYFLYVSVPPIRQYSTHITFGLCVAMSLEMGLAC